VPLFFSRTNISSLAKNAILVGNVIPSATVSTFRLGSLIVGADAPTAAEADWSEVVNNMKIESRVTTKIRIFNHVTECNGTLIRGQSEVII
jgi:hypothetical protein